MASLIIGKNIIQLEKVQSTNDYTLKLLTKSSPEEGTIVLANNQTMGKGQAGNGWESQARKNLTISIILKPSFLEPSKQFYISKIIALAIYDFLNDILENVSIKWPNDIYVNNDKIAGILIENSLIGSKFEYSVVGIGVNINQKEFSSELMNPTSLIRETGKIYDLSKLLNNLIQYLNLYYQLLHNGKYPEINSKYLSHIYRFREIHFFKTQEGIIKGEITDIKESGQLEITSVSGEIFYFWFKEIGFQSLGDF